MAIGCWQTSISSSSLIHSVQRPLVLVPTSHPSLSTTCCVLSPFAFSLPKSGRHHFGRHYWPPYNTVRGFIFSPGANTHLNSDSTSKDDSSGGTTTVPGESSGGNAEVEGPEEKGASSNYLMQKLKRYGVAGMLSYGLLNTAYYLTTFLIVWFYVSPAQAGMGFAAAAKRFIKLMAMVWAGSQVTKLLRAGGALALAPLVDNGLSWFTLKFGFKSKGKASGAIVGLCFGVALLLFFALTLLWA